MFGANSGPASSSGGLPPASELLSPPTNGSSYNRHLPPTSPQMAPPSPYVGTPGHYQSLTEPGTPVFLNPASVGEPVPSPSYESMSPASFNNHSASSTKPSTPMGDQASPAAYGQYSNPPYYPPHYQPGRLPPAESLPVSSSFGSRPQNFPRKPLPKPGQQQPQADSTLRQQLSRPPVHKPAPIDKRRHTISSQRPLPPLQQPLSVPPPSDHQPYYQTNGPKSVPNNFDSERPASRPSNHQSTHPEHFQEHEFEAHLPTEFDQYLPPPGQYYPQSPVQNPSYQQLEPFQPEGFAEFQDYPQDQFYDPQGNFIGAEVPYNVHQGPPPYDPNYPPPPPNRIGGPQQVVYHSTGSNGQPQTVVHTMVDPQNYDNGTPRPEDPPQPRPKAASPKKSRKKAETTENGEPKPKPKRIRKPAAQLRAEKAAREAAALEAQALQNGIPTNSTMANPHERIQIHNGQITRQPVQNSNGNHPQQPIVDPRPAEEFLQPPQRQGQPNLDDSASLMPPPKVNRAPSVLAAKAAAVEPPRPPPSPMQVQIPPSMGQHGQHDPHSGPPTPNYQQNGPNSYPHQPSPTTHLSAPATPSQGPPQHVQTALPVSGPMAPAYSSQTGSVQTGPTYSGSHSLPGTPGPAQVTGPHGSGYHPIPSASPADYRAPPGHQFPSHIQVQSYGHPNDQYGPMGPEDVELASHMDQGHYGDDLEGHMVHMDYGSHPGSVHHELASQPGSAGTPGSITPTSARDEAHADFERLDGLAGQVEAEKKPPPKRIRTAAHRAELQRQKYLKQREHELKQARENHQYLVRYMQLRKMVRALVFTNTALADEVSRVKTQIDVVSEQRKLVAKEVRHCERKRIRRMQTHERKAKALKAKLEAAELSGLNNAPFQAEQDSSTNNSYSYLHLDTKPSYDQRNFTVKPELASPGTAFSHRGMIGNGFNGQKMAGMAKNPTDFGNFSGVSPGVHGGTGLNRQGNGSTGSQSEVKPKRKPRPRKRPNPEALGALDQQEPAQPTKKKRLKKLEPLTVDTTFQQFDLPQDRFVSPASQRRLSSPSQGRLTSPTTSQSSQMASPQNLNNWPTDQIFLSPTELEPTHEEAMLQNFIPMEQKMAQNEESGQRKSEENEKTGTPGSSESVRTRFSARLQRQSQSDLPASPRSRTGSRSQISPRNLSTPTGQQQQPGSANGSQTRESSRVSSETPQSRSRAGSNTVQSKTGTPQTPGQSKGEQVATPPTVQTSEKIRNRSGTPKSIPKSLNLIKVEVPAPVQTRNTPNFSQTPPQHKERPLPSPIKLNPTPDELKEMKFEPHPEPTESTLDQYDEDRSYKSTPTHLEPPIQLPDTKRRTSSRQSRRGPRQSNTPTSLTESPSTSSCTSPVPLGEGTIVTRRKAAEAASLATTPTMQTRSKRKLHAS